MIRRPHGDSAPGELCPLALPRYAPVHNWNILAIDFFCRLNPESEATGPRGIFTGMHRKEILLSKTKNISVKRDFSAVTTIQTISRSRLDVRNTLRVSFSAHIHVRANNCARSELWCQKRSVQLKLGNENVGASCFEGASERPGCVLCAVAF